MDRVLIAACLLLAACPSAAPEPEPTPAPIPEATPEPTPEPTPAKKELATAELPGDVCLAAGLDRLPDGRTVVVDAARSNAVALFATADLESAPTWVDLSFKSMEGPLPETIEDLAAVASRGGEFLVVGSFAHDTGDGCPLPQHRAKLLRGTATDDGIEWQGRVRVTPCLWNGTGEHCRRPSGLTASVEACKAELFTSKITTSGDSVCGVLVQAEADIAAGTCGPGMAVSAATIVAGRGGKKVWLALRSPLSVAGETILLRLEQPLEQLSRFAFDRASYLELPAGHEVRGMSTEGDAVLVATDGPGGGKVFEVQARDLKDGESAPLTEVAELPAGVQGLGAGLSGAVALFGGTASGDACATKPRSGVVE